MNTTEFIDELREKFPSVGENSQVWYWLEKSVTAENIVDFLTYLTLFG